MKKIVIPVIIILMVILYLVFFRYNKIGVVEIDGYVITSENLYAKMNSSDNNDLELVEVKSLDNIYKQGNNYFIGDRSKQKVNLNYQSLEPIIDDKTLDLHYNKEAIEEVHYAGRIAFNVMIGSGDNGLAVFREIVGARGQYVGK